MACTRRLARPVHFNIKMMIRQLKMMILPLKILLFVTAVDAHWVIEPGTSYMMGYISR